MVYKYKNWKYKNTALLVASLIVLYYIADTDIVRQGIKTIGDLGYAGAFFTGALFVSTFTVAPALVILYNLADRLNPYEVALLAGAGAVLGDYIIYKFIKDNIMEELKPVFFKLGGGHIAKIFKTPYFAWLLPVVGAALIASPLPDEVGISILGISKLESWQFLLLSFVLNSIGIFIVVTLARAI